MKNHFRTAITFAVAAGMILATLTSCSNNLNESQNDNTDPATVGEEIVSGSGDDMNLRENTPDSLPSDLKFNGEEVRILHRSENEFSWKDEIAVDEEIGEIVNDAIYRRNESVEERLNVKIVSIPIPGGWNDKDNFLRTVRTSISAGSDDYDLIAGYAYYTPPLATEGMLYNLKDVKYLDPNAIWWSADCAEQMTIDNKLYFITGDIALSLLKHEFVMYFNKKLAQDLEIGNLYQVVLDGDFTIDKLAELTKGVYKDLNGNGSSDKDDLFGYSTTTGNFVDAFFSAFDQPIAKKDANGIPQLAYNTPKMIQMVEKLYSFFYEDENSYAISEYTDGADDSIVNMFIENRTLFMTGNLKATDTLRAMESDYGILPYPKWNKEQPAYYTSSQNGHSLFCIPVTCTKIDIVGATMEALCAESYRKVTPTYYEVALKQKYSRDDETSQMLDLIRDGIKFDFGMTNGMSLDYISNVLRDLMTDKKTDFTSRYEKSEAKNQGLLDKLLEAYQNLP